MTGLEPGQEVTVRAQTYYPDGGDLSGQYESFARFEVGGDGTLTVGEQAPIEGTYGRADPMGIFWSMRPRTDLSDPAAKTLDGPTADDEGRTVHLRATAGGERLATSTIRRRHVEDGVTSREQDAGIVGELFLPPGEGPHPSVVSLHGGGGGNPPGVRLLASRGIATLALKYFGPEEAIPDGPVEVPLEYFEQAFDWLTDQPEIRSDDIGVSGLSLGGEAALILASRYDIVDAAVAVSSPTVVFGSELTNGKSPWSYDGDPVSYIEPT